MYAVNPERTQKILVNIKISTHVDHFDYHIEAKYGLNMDSILAENDCEKRSANFEKSNFRI